MASFKQSSFSIAKLCIPDPRNAIPRNAIPPLDSHEFKCNIAISIPGTKMRQCQARNTFFFSCLSYRWKSHLGRTCFWDLWTFVNVNTAGNVSKPLGNAPNNKKLEELKNAWDFWQDVKWDLQWQFVLGWVWHQHKNKQGNIQPNCPQHPYFLHFFLRGYINISKSIYWECEMCVDHQQFTNFFKQILPVKKQNVHFKYLIFLWRAVSPQNTELYELHAIWLSKPVCEVWQNVTTAPKL